MSATIYQFVPKPNPNRDVLDRIHGVQANVPLPDAIIGGHPCIDPSIPYGGAGIDGMSFTAPDSDSA